MKAMTGVRIGVLLVFVCLAGCASSPPLRFYTLSPVGAEGANTDAPPAIRVVRVTLPGEIDRPELVQRIDANRLQLAENDRWGAPLGQMIQRALSADLQARVPATTGEPDQLFVNIEEFIGGPDCAVTLRAEWTLTPPGSGQQPIRRYDTVRTEPPPTCELSALPAAMSRALAQLSQRVIAARGK